MRHTFDLTVENQPAVLPRIAGMFAARGFTVDSLALGRTADPVLSRLTVTLIGDRRVKELVRGQLEKIVSVVSVRECRAGDADFEGGCRCGGSRKP